MEKILQVGDSLNFTYPQHFQTFLDNCIENYADDFGANDYLFAAVYFLVLETGFTPIEISGAVNSNSTNFDIRKLRLVTGYSKEYIKIPQHLSKSKYFFYQIPLKLGNYSSGTCELQGVPSAGMNPHLIINFLWKAPHIIKSVCLDTEKYIENRDLSSNHKYQLKNLKELSYLIKNKVAIHIKDSILTIEEESCCGNLLCLPEEIQKKIVYYLKNDPKSVQCLSGTCKYFHSFIGKDSKLWEEMCFQEYSGVILNKALQDAVLDDDPNVFRTVFLKLKTKVRKSNLFTLLN